MSRRRNSGRCFRCYFRPPLAARPSLPENGKCLFRGGECENGLDHLPTKKRARASVLLFRFSFVYRISHNRGSAFIFLKKNIYLYSPRYFSASRIKIAKEHISDNRSNKERKLFVSIRNIRKLDISRFDVQPFPSIHPRSSIFDTHEASFQTTRQALVFHPQKEKEGRRKKKGFHVFSRIKETLHRSKRSPCTIAPVSRANNSRSFSRRNPSIYLAKYLDRRLEMFRSPATQAGGGGATGYSARTNRIGRLLAGKAKVGEG